MYNVYVSVKFHLKPLKTVKVIKENQKGRFFFIQSQYLNIWLWLLIGNDWQGIIFNEERKYYFCVGSIQCS